MSERLFYCGTAPPPRDERRATQLILAGERRNINRDFEDIASQLVGDVPNHLRDLLDIATYVFVADRTLRRGGPTLPNLGSDWRRRLRFVIAVREPERWNTPEVNAMLRDLVGFASDDDYRFNFVRSDEPPLIPSHLPLVSQNAAQPRYDQILLFSGGLDSLAGAVRELSQTADRVVLVSHRSSDWIFSRQRDLAKSLSVRFPGRVLHVPVEITLTKGLHDAEYTQRTRSFLYLSFNLPIAPQIIGSRATRSTHPLVLSRMTTFAHQVLGHRFEVTNPFVWLTKAEVIRIIDEHRQTDLIKHSISCTHVRKTGQRAHCGECAQCVHRRFGTLAAGLTESDPLEGYEVELLADNREEGEARNMAISLVSSALEHPRLSPPSGL